MTALVLVFKLCAIAATAAAAGAGAMASWFAARDLVSGASREAGPWMLLSNLFSGGVLVAAALVHLYALCAQRAHGSSPPAPLVVRCACVSCSLVYPHP